VLTASDEIVPGIKYHRELGWYVESRLAALRLRREMGLQRKLIDWFLDKALETDDILYYRVMTRLIEIENESTPDPPPPTALWTSEGGSRGEQEIENKPSPCKPKIILERDTFNPFACDVCHAVDLCDKCFMELNIGGRAVMLLVILLALVSFLTSCQKDYAQYASPFYKGEKVNITGIHPRNSYRPYPCCTCPCYVDSVYKDDMFPNYWFYNIHDTVRTDSPLTHVANNDLKKW
jgi:hypothetical protein